MKSEQPKYKIVVGINTLTDIKQMAYSNHCQMWFRFGRHYIHDFCFVDPPRMSIDRMRNLAAEVALSVEADYLLFIDDDVLLPMPFDFLNKLINLNVDIAAGDVLIRGYPFNHMLFQWNKEKTGLYQMPNVPRKLGRISIGAAGFSCCLIKISLIKRLSPPFFVTGPTNTEDIYFCLKVMQEWELQNSKEYLSKHGTPAWPKPTMAADTSIQCGHILYNEIISATNKKNYKRYVEAQEHPQDEDESITRGTQYLKDTKETIDVHRRRQNKRAS